jgi:hypothetical protein
MRRDVLALADLHDVKAPVCFLSVRAADGLSKNPLSEAVRRELEEDWNA